MKLQSWSEYTALVEGVESALDELRGEALPAKPPCGYVNRAGDVTTCDHDTAEDIRARTRETGGYTVNPFPGLPTPVGLNWHGSDYRVRGGA